MNSLERQLNAVQKMEADSYYSFIDHFGKECVEQVILKDISKMIEQSHKSDFDLQVEIWDKYGYYLALLDRNPFERRILDKFGIGSKNPEERIAVGGKKTLQMEKLFSLEEEVYYGFHLLKRPYIKILLKDSNIDLDVEMIFSSIRSIGVCEQVLGMFEQFYQNCNRSSNFDRKFQKFLWKYRQLYQERKCVPNLKELSVFDEPVSLISEVELLDQIEMYIQYSIAKNCFMMSNIKMVEAMVRTHLTGEMPYEDLVQEGMLGMHRAIDTYDVRRGFKFSTYAYMWIKKYLFDSFFEQTSFIKTSLYMRLFFVKIGRAKRNFYQENGKFPTLCELANILEMDEKNLISILQLKKIIKCDSLDRFFDGFEEDDVDSTLYSFIIDSESLFEEKVIEIQIVQQLLPIIDEVLTDREKEVLFKRTGYLDDCPMTLFAIGKEQGCTRENIRLIEKKALKKLREKEEVQFLNPYQ